MKLNLADIKTRIDVELLVNKFYKKAINDSEIGFFFTDVISLELDKHIPRICSFWESVLLGAYSYSGNPIIKHIEINSINSLENEHFERWLLLWNETLDELFFGQKKDEASKRAEVMAELIKIKIDNSRNPNFIQ